MDRVPALPRRSAVRVIVLADARLLVLPTSDPDRSSRAAWLELPGGGLEPGEQPSSAAARELHEELGWHVDPAALADTGWRRSVVYPRREGWVWQDEVVLLLRLDAVPDEWSADSRTEQEQAAHGDPCWLPVADLHAEDRFFPDSLPDVLPRVLAGESVREPVSRFW
jgi:8-oxo-dGTP pyrophosphatase MutT (NUDIX family)